MTLVLLVFGLWQSAFGTPGDEDLRYRILIAEDARTAETGDLEVIRSGLGHRDPAIQRIAVRALGRLERPDLVDDIAALVEAADAGVRVEAANALGQAIWGLEPERAREARTGIVQALSHRLGQEFEPDVRGAIARTLGRLEYETEDEIRRAEALLAPFLARSPPEQEGAVQGLERLFRSRPARVAPAATTSDQLRLIVCERVPTVGAALESERYARVRRLALQTLGASGALDESTAAAGLNDADWQVRRLAAQFVGALPGGRALLGPAWRDASAHVRWEAARRVGSLEKTACPELIVAARDPDPHVAREAVRMLGRPCDEGAPDALALLARLARRVGPGARGWQIASAALGSLVSVCTRSDESVRRSTECANGRALARLHASNRRWQVRMYAAVPAVGFGDAETARRLARDPHPNVRETALRELASSAPSSDVDRLAIEALRSDDYQLVRTAARVLKSRGDPRAPAALRTAFDRLAAKRSDTARDPLTAIQDALADRGVRVDLTRATRPDPPFSRAELRGLTTNRWRAVVTVGSGGRFEVDLLAGEAPATVARFVRLARAGTYDGLTFHRVEPNFVIQGGSPGANEYAGHDSYMRDEVGLTPHLRGAIGISTRGRDTGDAQIFIDLVDLPRLDHRYTVFARVVDGLDVVDGILEGDVIDRIAIRPLEATRRAADLQN